MTAQPPDVELVRRARDGDRAAFDDLVRRHRDRVWSVALGVVRDPHDAEDVTQETFLAVLRHLGSFREGSSVTTWLHSITLRKAYDQLRKRVPLPLDPGTGAIDALGARDPDPQTTGLRQRALLDAIAGLEPGFRDAVLLVDVAGLDVASASTALGVAPGTVKSRVFRGRAALARALGTQGIDGASD